jgi:hypothetical protein
MSNVAAPQVPDSNKKGTEWMVLLLKSDELRAKGRLFMHSSEFERLCKATSQALGVDDPVALGRGLDMSFADVIFRAFFREGRAGFLLVAELGAAAPNCTPNVYEHLLATQFMTWDRPGLRFGFDPERRAVLLCAEIKSRRNVDGDWIAALVRCMAAQSLDWRETLLAGKVAPSMPPSAAMAL